MVNIEDQRIEKLINRYKLSEKEHNDIYQIIKKMVYENKRSVQNPIAIIVGAQPGSGKGSLIGYSRKMFPDNNVIIISSDDYKPFHPKAGEIAKKFPTAYLSVVEKDSARWTSKILQEAIQNKYNFIFEATLKNERILERMRELKENGFDVVVRGMAVSYLESLLSVYERYEKQVEARSWGRFFDPLNYNYIYKNIPNTIEAIEKSNDCDALEIYKRGEDIKFPQLIYATYKKEYKAKFKDFLTDEKFEYHTAKEAMIRYRNQEIENMEGIHDRVKKLEEAFKRRKTTQEEKEGMQILKDIIDNYQVL